MGGGGGTGAQTSSARLRATVCQGWSDQEGQGAYNASQQAASKGNQPPVEITPRCKPLLATRVLEPVHRRPARMRVGGAMADDEAPLLAAESDGSTGARPAAQQQHPDYPQWFSPPRLLALFCGVSLLVYLDRGALSSNGVNGSPRSVDNPEVREAAAALHASLSSTFRGIFRLALGLQPSTGPRRQAACNLCMRAASFLQGEGIQGDFDLDNFQDGLLPAAFMVHSSTPGPWLLPCSVTAWPPQSHICPWAAVLRLSALRRCGRWASSSPAPLLRKPASTTTPCA